jgi:phenylpyruvate tautomerase PptA (4-oxalocrotonate tautomerase family)
LNEVETFARAGERAGAAVGSGVQIARVQAARAGRQLAKQIPHHTARTVHNARKARDSAQVALAEVLAEHWGPALTTLAERWEGAQDVLAERLQEARHELATRIEPEPPARSRRWPWLVLLFLAIAGAVGAAVLTRRPQEIEPDPYQPRPIREPGSRDSDPDAAGGSPASNGVVGVERPSASTD